jgi:hypothetical protein
MNQIRNSRRKRFWLIFLPSFIFSLTLFVLAITPHYTCACGDKKRQSLLTLIINDISKQIVGKKIF